MYCPCITYSHTYKNVSNKSQNPYYNKHTMKNQVNRGMTISHL